MDKLKKELANISTLFKKINEHYDEHMLDINDQEADALYVMFKKMMDLKYDMEDYICEYKYKTETNQEYLDNVKKSIEEYDREHEILKKLIPFYYISSDIVDNLHNTIVNDSPIKVKKVKAVKTVKAVKKLKCYICNRRFSNMRSLLQHKNYKHSNI